MKPFDIELAKAGHPVRTRDGRAVRILCFDRKSIDGHSILALVDEGNYESFIVYTSRGEFSEYKKDDPYDLFMVPVKKEGWVNVFTNYFSGLKSIDRVYSTKAEALKDIDTKSPRYIYTVRIEWEE